MSFWWKRKYPVRTENLERIDKIDGLFDYLSPTFVADIGGDA